MAAVLTLAGYATKRRLSTSARAQVFEAVRLRDQAHVVAKVFEIDDEATRSRVEHEFRLLEQLDIPEVVRARGIERSGKQLVLLLDYVEGQSLAEYAHGRALAIDEFLGIAVRLSASLAKVHARHVIHRDIKPSNILVEAGTGALYIADFGISVLLEHQRRLAHEPDIASGTLPYISPEQTGKTQRDVDVRSDLYSLGVTFYELLTGRRPFVEDDPRQLIHAHLARRPAAPRQLRPELPERLSALIMKLLEKAPEHRYQSAEGLRADLERLSAALAGPEREPQFELGAADYSSTLLLPRQLYGREREREHLLGCLAELRRRAQPQILLIAGGPGEGKSALIEQLEAPLAAEGGHLVRAKFGLDARETPYAALLAGLDGFFDQLLTHSEVQLARWRLRLRTALGSIAGVLVELIPKLALVLGRVESVPELELSEGRNRLHLALERLLAAIAVDAPLVFVIEDLQWSDDASAQLLESLLGQPSLGPVLFIFAYRSAELRAEHPVLARARALEATSLQLGPLTRAELERMLGDLLGREREVIAPLAELISRKTGDNHLFVRQFLVHLGELGLLSPSASGWQWELAAIAAAGIPDDVLGVLRAKLERLPTQQRELLAWAACQGGRFELELLELEAPDSAADPRRSRGELIADLYALEGEGLIISHGASTYEFSHDRLQEAARALLDPRARAEVHVRIARGLLERLGVEPRSEHAYAIVEQLEPAIAQLGPAPVLERVGLELETLIEWFACAGQRALDAGAWLAARRSFSLAVELVESHAERGGERFFSAYFGRAMATGLSGDSEAEAQAFAELDRLSLSATDRARVAARRVEILSMLRHNNKAFELARASLAACGIEIPAKLPPLRVLVAILRTHRRTRKLELDTLMRLPEVEDADTLSIIHLLVAAGRAAFSVSPRHFAWLLALEARMLLERGYHPALVDGLAQFAFIVTQVLGVEAGARLGQLAVRFADVRELPAQAVSRVRSAYSLMTGPRHRPFAELGPEQLELFRFSLEVGDRLNACQQFAPSMGYRMAAGMHLGEALELAKRGVFEIPGAGQIGLHDQVSLQVLLRYAETLSSSEQPPVIGFFEIQGKLARIERAAAYSCQAFGWMLLGDYERAFAAAEPIADCYVRDFSGMWMTAEYTLCSAILAADRHAHSRDRSERRALRRRLRQRSRLAERWAAGCPENYGAMASLVAAELARVDGHAARALALYERARTSSSEHGMLHIEGLCCERLVALADAEGWSTIATAVAQTARRAYVRWGAHAVVARFDHRHPEIRELEATLSRSVPTTASMSAPGLRSQSSQVLDLDAVLATLRAISEQLRLDEVLRRVLASAIENAGADRGLLLLERDEGFVCVAEGDAEHSRERLADAKPLRELGEVLALSLVRYVMRTRSSVVVDDAREDPRFCMDPYVVRTGVPSLLCTPLSNNGELIALLVLENHFGPMAFTPKRVEVLDMFLAQAANALQNARLFAALASSEQRWKSLVDGVPDTIVVLDRDQRVEFVNDAGAYAAERLHGQEFTVLLDVETATHWVEEFALVLAHGQLRELELGLSLDERPARWHVARLTPIELDGHVGKVLAVFTDIHERRVAEAAKLALEAQLRQQQRLESIGTLASGVAHEINNPIQGIMNYAELLADRRDDPATVAEFAGEIVHEAERVTNIVRGLLTFARQEPEASFEQVAPAALVEAGLLLVRTVLRKDGIGLELDIAPELPRVACRPQQIQQVLMNLLTNARDALKTVELERARRRLELRVSLHVDSDASDSGRARAWVRFSVCDQGTGIPPEVQPHIFDPFFTTKGRDNGTGLGLAISHGIATEHGGRLSFETEVGVGTRFHLDLPPVEPCAGP